MTPFRISIAATVVALVLLLVVFELIRSRRLRERYALLWLATGLVLVALSAWRGGLNTIAGWLGVRSYPPAVLFAVGLLFVILVLLHYSTVISRLGRPEHDPRPAAGAARVAHGDAKASETALELQEQCQTPTELSGRARVPTRCSTEARYQAIVRSRPSRSEVRAWKPSSSAARSCRGGGGAGRSASTRPRRSRPRSRSARRSSRRARGSRSRRRCRC